MLCDDRGVRLVTALSDRRSGVPMRAGRRRDGMVSWLSVHTLFCKPSMDHTTRYDNPFCSSSITSQAVVSTTLSHAHTQYKQLPRG